jgi:hypothetical protein
VRVALAGTGDRWVQMEYRTTSDDLDPECDTALLEQGYATMTAIEGISEVSHAELRAQADAATAGGRGGSAGDTCPGLSAPRTPWPASE